MKIAAKLNKNLPNDFEKQRSKELLSFRSAIDFGITATALTIPRSGMETWMTDQTEICRCEGLTRIEVEREIENGAATPNAVKSGSRCGMGPCGGRFCQESLAILTGSLTGKTRDEIGLSTARSPLRPVAISDIAPDLDYEDLPIPGVSPL
jgi:bacterioferritin-associated ferredoxin